ncbi:hypothetical protein [Xanthomonas translucens]|uniref:hypothetical protein n=1 Tax=Xanthomonas campestris pv. translucens TaxID=343 RepID=UPI0012D8696E|nr:hypothetical protein [Xanthomonas translucens]QSQ43698.1 hypothetical protein ISN33_18645 [Xanthomonas translucens pv. translucens]WLA16597.1 hypothetical protein MO326_03265 [Xanthomonas translucens]
MEPGLGTRDSGLGTRDSGLGTRDSGLGIFASSAHVCFFVGRASVLTRLPST